MGKYDNIEPETLRADLLRFASFIQRLDAEDRLLDGIPRLLRLLGDLRQKLFAYEVRAVSRLEPREEAESPAVSEAKRIIEDAIRRERDMISEWDKKWGPERREEEDE